MPRADMIMALSKVLIAAAWSDGSIDNDELNSLKDLLFHLPGMTARDWAELEIYIDSPVDAAERARLIADLQAALATPRDRDLALDALDAMAQADGTIASEERQVLDEIRAALEDVNVSLFGQLGRLVRGPLQRRSAALDGAPNREQELQDFVQNKVYYKLRRHLEDENLALDLPAPTLRKLSLAGGLLARVAYVDREVTEGEFESIVAVLRQQWGLDRQEAGLVAEVAISEIGKDLDYYRLSRRFFELTSTQERKRFLNALFQVAAGDGRVSHEEMEEIRTISTVLKMTHQQYIDAKLSIPAEQRAY